MVEIRIEHSRTDQQYNTRSILIIGIFENEDDFLQLNEIDAFSATTINEIIKNKEFKGLFGSNIILYSPGNGRIRKVMLVGLGKREKFTKDVARVIAGKAALKAREMELSNISIIPFLNKLDEGLIEAIVEGILLSLYSFKRYKTNDEEKSYPR